MPKAVLIATRLDITKPSAEKKTADLKNRAKAGAARRAEQQGKGQGGRGGGGGGKGGSHYVRTQRDPGENANGGTNRKTTDFPVFASVAARKVIIVSIAQRVPKIPRSESLLGMAKEVKAT